MEWFFPQVAATIGAGPYAAKPRRLWLLIGHEDYGVSTILVARLDKGESLLKIGEETKVPDSNRTKFGYDRLEIKEVWDGWNIEESDFNRTVQSKVDYTS